MLKPFLSCFSSFLFHFAHFNQEGFSQCKSDPINPLFKVLSAPIHVVMIATPYVACPLSQYVPFSTGQCPLSPDALAMCLISSLLAYRVLVLWFSQSVFPLLLCQLLSAFQISAQWVLSAAVSLFLYSGALINFYSTALSATSRDSVL